MSIRILLSGLLAGSALLVSCSNEELLEAGDLDRHAQLLLQVSSQPVTKGVVTGNQLPDGATIGVSVVDDSGLRYDEENYANVPYRSNGTGEQTWNNTNEKVELSKTVGTVYAYYPYNEAVTSLEEIPVDATTGADYLYADSYRGVCFSSPAATLVMHHALACIRVKVESAGYTGPGEVSSISLMGVGYGTRAKLNAKTGELSSIEGKGEAVSDETGWNLSGSVAGHLLVAPTGETGNQILIVQVDGIYFRVVADPMTLEAGKMYEYTLQLSDDFVLPLTVSGVEVTDWTLFEATAEEGYQRHLLWDIAENGVYAVTSKGYLVYPEEADESCVAVAIIHHGVNKYLMIDKNESENPSYKEAAQGKVSTYQFIYGSIGVDIANLPNFTYVVDNQTYVFCTGTGTPQLTRDPTLWSNGGLSDWNGASNTEELLDLVLPPANQNYLAVGSLLKVFRTSDEALGYKDWYLPSVGEWALIMLHYDELNSLLSKIGGHVLHTSQNYLASTESSKDYKFFVGNNSEGNYIGRSVKQTVGRARFIRPLNVTLHQAE